MRKKYSLLSLYVCECGILQAICQSDDHFFHALIYRAWSSSSSDFCICAQTMQRANKQPLRSLLRKLQIIRDNKAPHPVSYDYKNYHGVYVNEFICVISLFFFFIYLTVRMSYFLPKTKQLLFSENC